MPARHGQHAGNTCVHRRSEGPQSETALKTNLVKTTGWAPVGKRLIDPAPFGHWHAQTFIAGLAHDGLIAPWVLDGAMNRARFDADIQGQLAPALWRSGPDRSSWPTSRRRTNQARPSKCSVPKAMTWSSCRPIHPTLASRKTVHRTVFLTLLSHRNGVLQAQNPDPKGRCQNLPSAV